MKTILFLFSFLLSISIFSQTNGEVVYKVICTKPTLYNDDNEASLKAKKMLSGALDIAKDFKFTLAFNYNSSLYTLEESLPNDGKDVSLYYVAKAIAGKGIFYQNKKEDIVIKQTSIMGQNFLISSKLFTDWEITNETKQIAGYICYKAIRKCETCPNKESESVWFTPDIPVPFGPLGYGGLPGLVVEVKKGLLITIRLETIEYTDEDICIDKPKKGKEITLEEYIKITNKYREEARNY